jgi:hypothetical protein
MPIVISSDNIEQFDNIVNAQDVLLRYHSPNCGHCIAMESEWKALDNEKTLKDKNIAIVDIDVGIAYTINHPSAKTALAQGVPSIYFIKKNQMFEYSGERKAKKIAEFAIVHLENSQPDISDNHPMVGEPQKVAGQFDIVQQFREYINTNSTNKPRRKTNKRRRNVRRVNRRPHKSIRRSNKRHAKSRKRRSNVNERY